MGPWIDCGRTYGARLEDEAPFEPKRGMLLEIIRTDHGDGSKEGRRVLVGDVNEDGGRCACCMGLEYDDFIVRYRMVDLDVGDGLPNV